MQPFSLQSYLNRIYTRFPEAEPQPVIGITANFSDGNAMLCDRYYKQVIDSGGTPLLLPPTTDVNVLVGSLEKLDGLLLTGGADLNPLWADEEPSPRLHGINSERDLPELLLTRLAFNRQIPILGICRGIQTLAIALEGKVTQDISEVNEKAIKHSQDSTSRSELTHTVTLETDSTLYNIYDQQERIFVNSFHHQAVSNPGDHLRVVARASDGTIEAVESLEHKPILGVQWHPEWLESGKPLFRWLVAQAALFSEAKRLHRRILTLDTHCDTPMFFHQDIHLDQRDSRILVDLQKMTEGHQDAVIMVAYLPQPKIGEKFSEKVNTEWIYASGDRQPEEASGVITPTQYADAIFDEIESVVRRNSRYVSIARTPADLYADKHQGRKSIILGIENGIALNHDLTQVKHFAQRGVAYITLCHNGDNDICDSNRGCNTHNGVSAFGEKVIQQMNQYGIMVDLSHAAEKSFYDAIDISATPIVCSHSNCRALCDHPRNLTDEQLRALAAKGGVAHTTLYPGFLRKSGQATILDAVEHLEHAIRVMGIDHVGLGTDFDGDGGVPGLADSSELINFTLQLLRRRYNERDIEKIWGGNWLRVMAQIQNFRK